MENRKNWIGKLLTEFVSVVFAVLLALGLNHWREAASEQQIAERALTNIFLEVNSNHKDIEDELPTYEAKIEEISIYKTNYETDGEYAFGFNMTLLNNSAWNVANSTGAIKDFDLELLTELSDIYTFQEIYQKNGIDYIQYMNYVEYKDENNIKSVLNSNLDQLKTHYAWSKQLSNMYLKFLRTHGNKYKELLPDSILTN